MMFYSLGGLLIGLLGSKIIYAKSLARVEPAYTECSRNCRQESYEQNCESNSLCL